MTAKHASNRGSDREFTMSVLISLFDKPIIDTCKSASRRASDVKKVAMVPTLITTLRMLTGEIPS